jgi:HK97 family phage prohead protease
MGRFKDMLGFGQKAELITMLADPPSREVATFSTDPEPVSIDTYIRWVNANNDIAPSVNRKRALTIPAVLRGRDLICNIASLPLVTWRGDNQVIRNELLEQIDPFGVTNLVTLAQTVEDLIFDSVSYWRVHTVNRTTGYPTKAYHLNLDSVQTVEPENARPTHLPSGVHPESEVWVEGVRVPGYEIIRFDSMNQPLRKTLSRVINRMLQTAKASQNYISNPVPQGVFTPKDPNNDPYADNDEARKSMQLFGEMLAENPWAYIGAALNFQPFDSLNPASLQMLDIEKMLGLGVANAMGLDPEDLGISTTSRTYQNAVDRRKDRINDLLNPYMQAITARLSLGDVTPRGNLVRFDQNDYLRSDPKTRAEVQQIYHGMGVITTEEIRQVEGYAPFTPQQKAELARQDAQEARRDTIRAEATLGQPKELNASQNGSETFSFAAPDVMPFNFGNDDTFAVDVQKRVIRGLAVPFDQMSTGKSRKFVFDRGSLKYTNLKHVKLLRDHTWSQLHGYVTELVETDRGYEATFTVAPGPEGDQLLAMAEHGTLDGLSVGLLPESMQTYTDPRKPGVTFVKSAVLQEISAVGNPSFPDSRVSAVYSTGDNMHCTRCGATDHAVDTCTAPDPAATFNISDIEKFKAIQQIFGQTVAAAKEPVTQTPSIQADPNVSPREVYSQDEPKGNIEVNEPIAYRFDGGESEHTLKDDLVAIFQMPGTSNAQQAQKRLDGWIESEFAVSTTNAASLNPTINKQEMYVDQLDYEYPIWDTINKGAPPNGVTPFQFPKWASSSGLVADHTEGTEPSLGSFAVTTQTVQPTALSGKIEINREAWDQMGTPNLNNLIRAEMRRAWFEGLETASAAFLDGLTLTGNVITLTTGAKDSVLDQALTGALVDLLFSRGGYRLRDFMVQGNLYKSLVLAVDDNKRRLFPQLGPQNATGTIGNYLSNLNINGLIGRPAWALGAIDSDSDDSYLFNRNDVHGWATNPSFLEFNIRVKSVDLGIWGYKAFANSRAAGVRRISYDPVV